MPLRLGMGDHRRHRFGMIDEVVRVIGNESRGLVLLDEEQVGEAMDMQPVKAAHAARPIVRQQPPAAPGHIISRAFGEIGADLEPRGIDDAIDLVFLPIGDHALRGDPFDALAVGVDQLGVGPREGLEIFVVEARALAQLAIPRLQFLARLAADDVFGARTNLAHLLVIGILESGHDAFRRALLGRHVDHLRPDALAEIGPAIVDEVLGREADAQIGNEVLLPFLLPAGLGNLVEPVAGQRAVVALVHARGCPL